ncbi:hypothetical protein ACFL6C_10520, partial [Myxococcota bacterium]
MSRGWYGRLVLVAGVLGLASYLLYPSYVFYFEATAEQREDHDKFCEALPSWAPCTKFNLGLDLQGGVHQDDTSQHRQQGDDAKHPHLAN